MRIVMIVFCLFAAACSNQPASPTGPSAVTGVSVAQTSAAAGTPNIRVTFTKWVAPAFPNFEGISGGDVAGAFAATVVERTIFDNGEIVQLVADYRVIGNDPDQSFVARIDGTQNNQTQRAVLNGTVTEGWLVGARVHVAFDVIRPCPEFNRAACFSGEIRVMAGSAN